MDLKLDGLTNDLQLQAGRLATVTATAEKAQRIRSRLLTVKGSWFLDTNYGLDYFGVIWVKTTPLAIKVAHVIETILLASDDGDQVTRFDIDFDTANRVLSGSADVTAKDGSTITVSV
jgi:hypothetical protein